MIANVLTELEESVLRMLLSGNHHVLSALRAQIQHCRVTKREMTGVGFFTHLDVPNLELRVPLTDRTVISDVIGEIAGLQHGAGFVLYIVDGRMQLLEGYTYDEPWPKEIVEYSLRYSNLPRDLSRMLSVMKD